MITYAKVAQGYGAKQIPENVFSLEILKDGEPIKNDLILEINTVEGWYIRFARDVKGHLIPSPDGYCDLVTERVEATGLSIREIDENR